MALDAAGSTLSVASPVVALPNAASPLDRGLLVTDDQALVRSFRRALRDCVGAEVSFDLQNSIEEPPAAAAGAAYQWVTIDLQDAMAPAEAVRLARSIWPDARLAVLSYWWSERDTLARQLADLVIHKPPRAQELRALIRPPAPSPPGEMPHTATSA